MHDLRAPFPAEGDRVGRCDMIVAAASESHVNRSIDDPVLFARNNMDVAITVLEYARRTQPESVVMFSTDEVYGPIPRGGQPHREWAPILPANPYAASKAAQEPSPPRTGAHTASLSWSLIA